LGSRPRRKRGAIVALFTALALALTGLAPASPAAAAPILTITPVTWNVLGLDSNNPVATGPDTFPVGARVCNTGDTVATGLTSAFVFDSANAFVNLVGPSSLALGDLAPGACVDAYYNVVLTRNAAAFDTSRLYRITATASGLGTVSTPLNRELYVEKLISQNRNAVLGITGGAIDVAPSTLAPGHATLIVGQTYTFTVTSKTATGGYEQLESFLNFPNTIFQILSVNSSYAQPPGATNDTIYADACGWDNNIGPRPSAGTYLSCIGPENYLGGKAGGSPIVTTYTVKVIQAGTGTLSTLIYDFSGSSFHYNSDFGANVNSVQFDALNPPDLTVTKSHSGTFVAGSTGSYTISVANVGGSAATGTTTVTDVLPVGLSFQSAVGTGWTCGASGQTVTCTRTTDIAAGATAPAITLTVGVSPTAPSSVTNTATVANAGDANSSNNSANDPTAIDLLPVAANDSAATPEDTPVSVSVLANDTLGDPPTTISANSQGTNGTVVCGASSCTYTPNSNFNGSDSFTYTITDVDGDTSTATVSVTVSAVNDPPVAVADSASTPAGTPVAVGVVANDRDPDGDPLTVTANTQGTNGTVVCGASSCTYTPNAGFNGSDSFTYTVGDGQGGTATATVTVTVNPPADLLPVAANDSAATPEDTPVSASSGGLPVTGSELAGLGALGAALAMLGVLMLIVVRRRKEEVGAGRFSAA
jgi:uncharacterized repeat protein (TIGR01451 family)/LPXTG-motif cell wall-anchored protein